MTTFTTTDTEHAHRNGSQCTIIRTISEPDDTHDTEALPMHVVRFADGVEIEAFDDEVNN